MRKVDITERTFERLQRHAVPLVDTADTVINRAFDALERIDQKRDLAESARAEGHQSQVKEINDLRDEAA